jgi:hypothetical protein
MKFEFKNHYKLGFIDVVSFEKINKEYNTTAVNKCNYQKESLSY